jgi:exodeoxyribonuclease V gamma subunit
MIKVCTSHTIHKLADKLAEHLNKKRGDDPFAVQQVVVQNQDTARWLKLYLADKNEICAQIEFVLPARWQYGMIRNVYPELPGLLPSDIGPMTWSLYELLLDPANSRKLGTVAGWLNQQNHQQKELSVFRFARQVASVFDQYLVYRPEMMLNWQKGESEEGEEWQPELWRLLNDQWKSLDDNKLHLNRAELVIDICKAIETDEYSVKEPLYLFNTGLLPSSVALIVKALGNQTDIHIFSTDCTGNNTESNKLTHTLGDEQRKIKNLFLSMGAQAEIIPAHPDTGNSNLAKIRNAILSDSAIEALNAPDGSIRIHSCYHPVRELETLHHTLLSLFENDPDLNAWDVLVVTPDLSVYTPFIDGVFESGEEGMPKIPWNVADQKYYHSRDVYKAAEMLLSLADSRFDTDSVLAFLSLEAVRNRYSFSDYDISLIQRWFEDNQVYWGLSSDHRLDLGDPAEDLHTLDSALKRGWLGLMGGVKPGELFNDELLYTGINSGEQQEVWSSVSEVLRKLDDFRKKSAGLKTISEWIERLNESLKGLIPEESASGEGWEKFIKAGNLITEEMSVAGTKAPIPFVLFRNLFFMASETGKSGAAFFTRGVVFSSMVPVRSLPFKVIAQLGLNDDVFPRKPVHPDFDLMTKDPKPGERNRRDEDKNLFLESIMAAEKVHYCSFIGRNAKSDEEIPPSSILSGWISVLADASGTDEKAWVNHESLYVYSSVGEQSMPHYSKVDSEVSGRIGKGEKNGFEDAVLDKSDSAKKLIDPADLERFYANPLKAFLTEGFGARFSRDSDERNEFNNNSLESYILFQQVFGWLIEGMDEERIAEFLLKSGSMPAGWSGVLQAETLIDNAKSAVQYISERGLKPSYNSIDINIQLNYINIRGLIKNYSSNDFLDISASKASGKTFFYSWIRHLLMSVNDRNHAESDVISDIRTEPKHYRFKKAANADELLSDLLAGYESGLEIPLPFFPKTAYEYVLHLPDENTALAKADGAWKSGYQKYGENEDTYIKTMLGPNPELNIEEWEQTFSRFMQPMIDHLEGIK